MDNAEIARLLIKIADELEINGHNPYRIRAYRRAARSINRFSDSVHDLVKQNADLTIIPNIGNRLAGHIKALITYGDIPFQFHQEKAKASFRHELKDIPGLGPKRIAILAKQLNVHTKQDLLLALKAHRLREVKGFGEQFEEQLLRNIRQRKKPQKAFKYRFAKLILDAFMTQLNQQINIEHWVIAGEFRRETELIGDVTIVMLSREPDEIIDRIVRLPIVSELIEVAVRSVSLILQSGMRLNVHIATHYNFINTLVYATGSNAHLERLVKIAEAQGFQMTKTGFLRDHQFCRLTTETELYEALSLDYIDPVLREDRGEIEAAALHRLPKLISLTDIKGDLHAHTNETDGVDELAVMAAAAQQKGYAYLAITDHSQRLAMTNGLNEKRLRQQLALIDELNNQYQNFTILKSIEVDILEDGSLDLPNSVLKELDLCVCSIHSRFNLSLKKQTERIIRAMDNPYFSILGHATGRLLQHRAPYAIDIERVLEAALERGCVMELNAQPARLDIKDIYCHLAKLMGVKIAISSDAHSTYELDNLQYGVMQGRRGWLEKADVINTYSLNDLKNLLKRQR